MNKAYCSQQNLVGEEALQQPPKGAVYQHFGAQNVRPSASPAPPESESPQQVSGAGLDGTLTIYKLQDVYSLPLYHNSLYHRELGLPGSWGLGQQHLPSPEQSLEGDTMANQGQLTSLLARQQTM